MSRTSIATPCPAPLGPARRVSFASLDKQSDDTAEIDYTRAIQHEIRSAKPRRRQSINGIRSRNPAPITIFEDVIEDEELAIDAGKRLSGKTLLGKPAQRIRSGVPKSTEPEDALPPLREASQARRRSSFMPFGPMGLAGQPGQMDDMDTSGARARRETRRRTIFVPNDDTTIMTIHPGANLTERLNDTFHLQVADLEPLTGATGETQLENSISMKKPLRRPRKSLASAPKRVPLAHMESRQNLPGIDTLGQGDGKENFPPGSYDRSKLKPAINTTKEKDLIGDSGIWSGFALDARIVSQPVHSQNLQPGPLSAGAIPSYPSVKSRPKRLSSLQLINKRNVAAVAKSSPPTDLGARPSPRIGIEPAKPQSNASSDPNSARKSQLRQIIANKRCEMQNAKLRQYPVLAEDIAQPDLYENGWLSQQEAALTEVVNQMFAVQQLSRTHEKSSPKTLRKTMIEMYHQPETSMMHQRLQASLVYGALSRPADLMDSSKLSQDLGLRKRFIGLWLDTYQHNALRTAAEVVVGRQMLRQSDNPSNDLVDTERLLDPHSERRAITDFLETFFVSASDVQYQSAGDFNERDFDTLRWRKTMLRSLMLVWLLDQAKNSEVIEGCLFKRKSTKKSSCAVLHSLSSLLIPSVGDIIRALRHMDYSITCVQDPLDEVSYHIDNLAVDLRDGVLLARLVETLLYSSDSRKERSDAHAATVTIVMPDLGTLESAIVNESMYPSSKNRILSQHLRLPAIGRAQKVHNVQVSLSALESHNVQAANVVGDITAADIVDGHREKTLSLLWALVSAYGLDQLVDWRSLALDTARQSANTNNNNSDDSASSAAANELHPEARLQSWANAHALRAQLPPVHNLTTAFADGSVYSAIIGSFAPFLPADIASPTSAPVTARFPPGSTAARLCALGCSAAFAAQLAAPLALIPSRATTLATLAFLAARLLPLARAHQAAGVLQRVWRLRKARAELRRRVALMRLASACAGVVRMRSRIEAAAVVLQRAWRAVLDARVARLERAVGEFQAVARGWATRRGLRGAMVVAPRVMGGW